MTLDSHGALFTPTGRYAEGREELYEKGLRNPWTEGITRDHVTHCCYEVQRTRESCNVYIWEEKETHVQPSSEFFLLFGCIYNWIIIIITNHLKQCSAEVFGESNAADEVIQLLQIASRESMGWQAGYPQRPVPAIYFLQLLLISPNFQNLTN